MSAAITKKLKYCWLIEFLQTTHDEIGFIQSGWSQGEQISWKEAKLFLHDSEACPVSSLPPACLSPGMNKCKSRPKGKTEQDLSKNIPAR